jgi:hypothetical protein
MMYVLKFDVYAVQQKRQLIYIAPEQRRNGCLKMQPAAVIRISKLCRKMRTSYDRRMIIDVKETLLDRFLLSNARMIHLGSSLAIPMLSIYIDT